MAWKADLAGWGNGTPVVWGDHVFVTGADPQAEALKALCLDRRTLAPGGRHPHLDPLPVVQAPRRPPLHLALHPHPPLLQPAPELLLAAAPLLQPPWLHPLSPAAAGRPVGGSDSGRYRISPLRAPA